MVQLSGVQIDLKSFTQATFQEYFRNYVSDPIAEEEPFHYNEKRVRQGYEWMSDPRHGYVILGIFRKDGTPIGDLSFRDFKKRPSSCVIGITLGREEYKNHGYGSEALGLAIHYAFDWLHVDYLLGDTLSSNYRMQRLFERYHFIQYETYKHFRRQNNVWVDNLYYRLPNPALSL